MTATSPLHEVRSEPALFETILELIRRTSTQLPDDVVNAITAARKNEAAGSNADVALDVIGCNIGLAQTYSLPLCQDTGTILFYVHAPVFHFHQWREPHVEVKLVLKGGGCENMNAQYSLPHPDLGGRDLKGVENAVLDAVLQAQGQGCGPGILGVCIGGDRATGYGHAKEQLLRTMDDRSPDPELAALEQRVVEKANQSGIGPMGFGGKTTLLGCKIGKINRLPASFFVSVAYMCWAFRRRGVNLDLAGNATAWLY